MAAVHAGRRGSLLRLIALVAPALAVYDYFISSTGDDTAAGTTAAPFASLNKAISTATAGQSIGITPNTTLLRRDVTDGWYRPNITVAGTPGGAAPTIDGGYTLSGWQPYDTVLTNPELVVNGDFENGSPDNRNWAPFGWHSFTGGGSYVYKETGSRHGGATAARCLISGGTLFLDYTLPDSVPAGTQMVWDFWTLGKTTGGSFSAYVERWPTAGGTQYLQGDGTWGGQERAIQITPTTTWAKNTLTFTSDTEMNYKLLFGRWASTDCDFFTDDWSAHPTAPLPKSSNTYRALLPANTGMLTRDGDYRLPAHSKDHDRLADQRYALPGDGWIYLRNDAGRPDDRYRTSSGQTGAYCYNATSPAARNLRFTHVKNGAIDFRGTTNAIVEDITIDNCGQQNVYATSNGVISFSNSDDVRLSRVYLRSAGTDGIYHLGGERITIEDVTVILAYGEAADAMQFDSGLVRGGATSNITTAAPVVRRWYSNQVGTPSPKGNIITFLDGGVFEDCHVAGGQFGISVASSDNVVRRSVAHNIYGPPFGNGGNGLDRDRNVIEDCLVYDSRYGYATLTSAERSLTVRRHTGLGTTTGFYSSASALSGSVEDSIFWSPGRTAPLLEVAGNQPKASLVFSRCILGPEIPGVPFARWNGVDYATMADFAAAGGQVAGCSTANPLLETRGGVPYQLAAGSPALTMAVGGGRIGCDTSALHPGPAFAPGGAALAPSWPAVAPAPLAAPGSAPATSPQGRAMSLSATAPVTPATALRWYRDGVSIGVSSGGSFIDAPLVPGERHVWTVAALGAREQVSAQSPATPMTTLPVITYPDGRIEDDFSGFLPEINARLTPVGGAAWARRDTSPGSATLATAGGAGYFAGGAGGQRYSLPVPSGDVEVNLNLVGVGLNSNNFQSRLVVRDDGSAGLGELAVMIFGGRWVVRQYLPGGASNIITDSNSNPVSRFTSGAGAINVRIIGSTLTLSIGGSALGTATIDATLGTGSVGIVGGSSVDTTRFDKITIARPV